MQSTPQKSILVLLLMFQPYKIRVLRKIRKAHEETEGIVGDLLEIVTMTNEHPDFYCLLGRFLARREIAKEIGAPYEPFWDDDGKVWFVTLDQGKVAGFATLLQKGRSMLFVEAYVLPAYRNQGLHARLIDARLAHCSKGAVVQVIVKSKTSSREPYIAKGFTVKRERGKAFTEMIKTIGEGSE